MAMTVFSLGIISSILISNSSNPILDLLSSPYLSAIDLISVLITPNRSFSSPKIALSSAILFTSSACSASNFSLSRPVRARSLISTIACACASERPKRFIKFSFATCVFALPLMIFITSSILSSAISKPCKI